MSAQKKWEKLVWVVSSAVGVEMRFWPQQSQLTISAGARRTTAAAEARQKYQVAPTKHELRRARDKRRMDVVTLVDYSSSSDDDSQLAFWFSNSKIMLAMQLGLEMCIYCCFFISYVCLLIFFLAKSTWLVTGIPTHLYLSRQTFAIKSYMYGHKNVQARFNLWSCAWDALTRGARRASVRGMH